MGISNELCFIENCKQIYHKVVKTVLLIEIMHLMSILTFGLCKKELDHSSSVDLIIFYT